MSQIKKRKDLYYKLNSMLSQLDNTKILKQISNGKISEGWGGNSCIKVGDSKVFVKTIPLTQEEYDHSFSTKNIFNLPLYYNYGVGSAGLGAFRELIAHIKTTNWVLCGEHHNFPLMYHYRIVPVKGKQYTVPENTKKYIKNWNNSKKIEVYVNKRKRPSHEIILCLEFFPNVMHKWIEKNSNKVQLISKKLYKTFNFLLKKEILHFDSHWRNILIGDDGEPYLTDFGLLLDYSYCHTKKEKEFFRNHTYYDHAQFTGYLIFLLEARYHKSSQKIRKKLLEHYGVAESMNAYQRSLQILNHLESINQNDYLNLDKNYIEFLEKNKKLIIESNLFFMKTRFERKTIYNYKKAKLKKLLIATGVISR